MIIHELKILPEYYCRVADGSKTFEVRENDRGFLAGDKVILREYQLPTFTTLGCYTGKPDLYFKIGYVLPIDDKRVVFSLLPLESK